MKFFSGNVVLRSVVCGSCLLAGFLSGNVCTAQEENVAHGSRAFAASPPNDHFEQPASTRRMIERVRKIHDEADPLLNPYRSEGQIPLLQAMEKQGESDPRADPRWLTEVKLRLAVQLLQAGRTEDSFRQYEDVERYLQQTRQPVDPRTDISIRTGKALCHLRAGEKANCLSNHNGDSCIFPIRGGGVHLIQDGSRAAVGELNGILTKYPGDLRARWLLNVAEMTLGEYPDGIPSRLLIPPERFAAEEDFVRFPDVAGALGLDVNGLAGGVVMEDFDHDGFLDVMVSEWGFTANDGMHLFRNNGDGTFTDRADKAGLAGIVGGLNLIHGDYDNDGFADVLVLRGAWFLAEGHYPISLLRNNGDFTFTDVTEEAGLLRFKPTQTAVWFDFDGDGWLDIFVGNESTDGDPNPCELFRNNADPARPGFTECAAEDGVAVAGYIKSVVSGDFNNDGRPDLFLSGLGGDRVLLRNDGPGGASGRWIFTNVADEAGIDGPVNSFPSWFWDYDNDGWLDLMVTGYSIQDVGDIAADYLGRPTPGAKAKLYHNNGDGTFANVSREAGVNRVIHAMGANFGDLDNDGWLDFYAGTGNPDFATIVPSRMFRNDGGWKFLEVTTPGGFGQLQKGHGIAFGDIDNDGDQEIYSVVGGALDDDAYPNQLFANPGHGNRWLKLQLDGVRTNRVAIGARVKVVVLNATGAERAIHRVVGTGASFGSNPLRLEIGLGRPTSIDRVEVFWPVTGVTQIFKGLEVDRMYFIREGEAEARPADLKRFMLPLASGAEGHQHQM